MCAVAGARNAAQRDAIASVPVTVRRGAMDDAWREIWDGGAGQPYSAVVFKSSTTNDNRNLASLTILLVHYRTRFISVASGNVCAEPIVCCVMIGRNPSHADRACAP